MEKPHKQSNRNRINSWHEGKERKSEAETKSRTRLEVKWHEDQRLLTLIKEVLKSQTCWCLWPHWSGGRGEDRRGAEQRERGKERQTDCDRIRDSQMAKWRTAQVNTVHTGGPKRGREHTQGDGIVHRWTSSKILTHFQMYKSEVYISELVISQ